MLEILESHIPENDVAMARILRYAGLFETVHYLFPWTPSTLIMFIDYRCSLRFLWNWKVSYGVTSVGLSGYSAVCPLLRLSLSEQLTSLLNLSSGPVGTTNVRKCLGTFGKGGFHVVQLCFLNREPGRSFSMIDWSGSPACLSVRFALEAVPSMLDSRAPASSLIWTDQLAT